MSNTLRSTKVVGCKPPASEQFTSPEALRAFLVSQHRSADAPITLILEVEDGTSLYLGVGHPETSVVVHEPRPDDERTAEWISAGDPQREGEVDFFLCDHHTPQESRSLIPFDVALDAAIRYFSDGIRSDRVVWVENQF